MADEQKGLHDTDEDLAALDAEIAAQLDAEAAEGGVKAEWFVIHS